MCGGNFNLPVEMITDADKLCDAIYFLFFHKLVDFGLTVHSPLTPIAFCLEDCTVLFARFLSESDEPQFSNG